jgi:hypothetical protein
MCVCVSCHALARSRFDVNLDGLPDLILHSSSSILTILYNNGVPGSGVLPTFTTSFS